MRYPLFILALISSTSAMAQSAPKHYLSAASTNCTLVQAGKGVLSDVLPVNTTAVIYYLKIYDKATAPVAASDTPQLTFPIPATSGLPLNTVMGFAFSNGIGFCLTGGIADNDNTNAATGVAINLGVRTN